MNNLSLFYFSWIWAIYLSLSLFWHALWACGIPSLGMHLFYFRHAVWLCGIPSLSMHLFFIEHTIDDNMERVIMKQSWSFCFMNGLWMMLIPSVGILHMNIGVYVILLTKAWKKSCKGHTIWENSMKWQAAYG